MCLFLHVIYMYVYMHLFLYIWWFLQVPILFKVKAREGTVAELNDCEEQQNTAALRRQRDACGTRMMLSERPWV